MKIVSVLTFSLFSTHSTPSIRCVNIVFSVNKRWILFLHPWFFSTSDWWPIRCILMVLYSEFLFTHISIAISFISLCSSWYANRWFVVNRSINLAIIRVHCICIAKTDVDFVACQALQSTITVNCFGSCKFWIGC